MIEFSSIREPTRRRPLKTLEGNHNLEATFCTYDGTSKSNNHCVNTLINGYNDFLDRSVI